MKLAYLDPVRGSSVEAESLEALARQIADSLPAKASVRFTTAPFPLDESSLKQVQVQFEREKLPARHDFACRIAPAELTAAGCEILNVLNFQELEVGIDLAAPAYAELDALLALTRHQTFRLVFVLEGDPATVSLETLSQLYFFLRGHFGAYALSYRQGFFDRLRVDHAFRRLAGLSQEVHLGRIYDARLQQQVYRVVYEYLRHTLSPRVKTVLEINPYADLDYYRDFNRIAQPWKVTLSGLKNGQLDLAQLQAMGKTFDAIMLYQALPRLRDPQKEILQLQNFARSTTEWVCVQYNTCSFPTLAQLTANEFNNAMPESAYWPILRLQSRQSVEDLFKFSGVNFEWIPTRVPIEELRPLKNQLDPLFKEEIPDDWDRFLDDADVMAWTGYGVMKLEAAELEAEGFVSGGFL